MSISMTSNSSASASRQAISPFSTAATSAPCRGEEHLDQLAIGLAVVGQQDADPLQVGRARADRRSRRSSRRAAFPACVTCRKSPIGNVTVKVVPVPSSLSTDKLAAERRGNVLADRQAQARAAETAGHRAVGLNERLEDVVEFRRVDADAGVAHFQRSDSSDRPRDGRGRRSSTLPCSVNLIALPTRFISNCRRR